ncbi:hypothetical protein G4Y79_23030 [Phototrophicus methaneseepsis]|uniref:STAS/SEC14 domain-containing protein n=1 Tax=Phototrophicus methaneseepsis TaxID=2710758 RepID=A0A7S8E8V2_9CHLR|nr:hypothetical protein [Phototrophicus methaneseepsis]QPC82525.1 hypothetical protein G4Y79_23030 [Phototrophicus methaneseepsis]
MTFYTYYDDEKKTILCAKVCDHWTLSDFFSFYSDLCQMSGATSHPVAFLVDLHHVTNMPTHFLMAGQYMLNHRPENHVVTVAVSKDIYVANTLEFFRQAFPRLRDHFFVMPSMVAAKDYLQHTMPTMTNSA